MQRLVNRLRESPWTTLTVLTLAYVCSGVDRLIITLLVEPIKADLHLTDTQIGMLQGFAFLLIYSLVGIPAGYLVDRVNRLKLVAAGVCLWSAMTSFCGLAQNFLTLFVGRSGVGIGEATLTPAAYSLISDKFDEHRRGLAIGLYQSLAGLGTGASFVIAGGLVNFMMRHGPVHLPLLGEVAPWQMTFMVLGVPGLAIAALLLLLIEPARAHATKAKQAAWTWRELRDFYASHRTTLLYHHFASGLTGMVVTGTMAWTPAFVMRVYDWSAGEAGIVAGAAMIMGSCGVFGGGALSDYLLRHRSRSRILVCAWGPFIGTFAIIAFSIAHTSILALALLGIVMFCAGVPYGASTAALQTLAPSSMRGTVSAVFLLVFSLVAAFGPIAIGLTTDRVFAGTDGIRYSMAIVIALAFSLSTLLFLLVIRPYNRSIHSQASQQPSCALA